MAKPLEKEFKFFLANQQELVEKYEGKFVVIKNSDILGAYDSEIEAIEKTSREHEPGTFLVQRCEIGTESYTYTFHSRVAFA